MATSAQITVLVQGTLLSNVTVSYYTAPTKSTTLIRKLTITNTTGSPVDFTLYKVPVGGSPSSSNILVNAQTIPAAGMVPTVEIYAAENHALNEGDSIQAFASTANALTIQVSGIVFQ